MFWIIGLGVFAILFLESPRTAFSLLSIAVCFVLAIGAFFYLYIHHDESERQKVSLNVEFNISKCSANYPLLINITNGSTRPVSKIDFDFEARKQGFSDNLVTYSNYNHTDKILMPSETYEICWRLPDLKKSVDPSELEWTIYHPTVIFE
jgi:hypothetical protein